MPQHRKTRVVANLELCGRPGGRVSANEEAAERSEVDRSAGTPRK